jgi:DNA-binding IclR family transcriptional regulator
VNTSHARVLIHMRNEDTGASAHAGPRAAVPTLAPLRVMRIIGTLASQEQGLGLGELSARTGVPKSSLLSLLRTLDSGGYVDAVNGLYVLGPESFALGAAIARSRPFPDNLRPFLTRLHQQCGETVLVSVPSDDWRDVVYVDLLESAHSLRFKVSIGSRDPLYCTALGLSMLAFAAPEVCEHYFDTVELKRLSAGTITSKTQLSRVLAQARAERVLTIPSGINENVTAIAAPVFDGSGEVAAAVALAGLSSNVTRNKTRLSGLVARTAEQMSRALGNRKQHDSLDS